MTVREVLKVLRRDGWVEKEQKGSHLQLEHPIKKGKVTVPVHGGDIPKGTLNSILKQAQTELYGKTIVSVEPASSNIEKAEGLAAVIEKGKRFADRIEERHGGDITDPVVTGDFFSMGMTLDATMKGQGRMLLEEICVYKVENGKIVYEQFIY